MQPNPSPTTASQVLDAAVPTSTPKTTAPASGAAPTPDGTAGTAPLTPAPDDKISPKLQLLIQRERATLAREQALKAKEAEIAAREAKAQEFEGAKGNPDKALELLGLSYDELTRVRMADGQVPPDLLVKKVEDKFDSYVKAQEADRAQQAEAQKQEESKRHAHTVEKFKSEIGTYLKENAHRYELIEFEQAHELVYEVIDEHYNRTLQAAVKAAEESGEDTEDCRGDVMTIAQASDKIELHLEQKYQKAKDLKKVAAFLAPRPALPAKPKTPTAQPPKTLTNQSSATPTPARTRPLSDDERIAKAIAYARGLRPAA